MDNPSNLEWNRVSPSFLLCRGCTLHSGIRRISLHPYSSVVGTCLPHTRGKDLPQKQNTCLACTCRSRLHYHVKVGRSPFYHCHHRCTGLQDRFCKRHRLLRLNGSKKTTMLDVSMYPFSCWEQKRAQKLTVVEFARVTNSAHKWVRCHSYGAKAARNTIIFAFPTRDCGRQTIRTLLWVDGTLWAIKIQWAFSGTICCFECQ